MHLPDASADDLLIAACAAASAAAGRRWDGPSADAGLVAEMRPSADPAVWLGHVHEAVVDRADRDRRGAHYTPAPLAAEVVAHTLQPLLAAADAAAMAQLRIVDPACGAGAFLLAARRALAAALATAGLPAPDAASVRAVLGADLDPWACRLARVSLALDAGVPFNVPRVVLGDALLGPTSVCTHDEGGIDWREHLDGGVAHAVVGNPPFLGGKRIRTVLGTARRDALRRRRALSGNADLAAHFVHLARELLREGGRFGLVLTDTIAQGDTGRDGLRRILDDGVTLVRAVRSRPWPGHAKVRVAVVHGVVGPCGEPRVLDGRTVAHIGSHLRSDPLDRPPDPLPTLHRQAFIGCDLKGTGFLFGEPRGAPLSTLEALRRRDPRADEVIRPYVTGRTLTDRPDGVPARWVIDLAERSLERATRDHPTIVAHLERRVRADRSTRSPEVAAAPWWRFWRIRAALRRAIAPLDRCLVAPVVARHLLWSWQPTDRIFSHKVCVVATDDPYLLGVLQSRLHEHWARALSSTLGGGLNYTPSRCFETFPLPPRTERIVAAADHLERTRDRACHMLQLGRSTLRTRCLGGDADRQVAAVSDAHRALDAAVAIAFGWEDLDLDDADACLSRLLDAHRAQHLEAQSGRPMQPTGPAAGWPAVSDSTSS